MAVKIYIGNEIIKRLEEIPDTISFETVIKKLNIQRPEALGHWIDMSGMFAPTEVVENLLASIREDQLKSLDDLTDKLRDIHEDYDKNAWAWCVNLIEKNLGIKFKDITKQHIIQIINDWKENSLQFNGIILKDAEKEFSEKSRIGYGIDGDEDVKNKDFEAVLGKFEENKFVIELKEESETIKKRTGDLINLPEKYPITSRYYQLLFGGQLGYQKVAQFTSYPSLFGIKINDDKSEETFQVYDHPKVMIFKNKKKLNRNEIKNILSVEYK